MTTKSYHQLCGLAYALDIIGERWTILLFRELIPGPRRFKDLMDGLPGISTNLLTERLKFLEQQGMIHRRTLPPPAGSTVYELTALGQGLETTLIELGKWGSQFVPASPEGETMLHVGSYALTLKTFFRPELAHGVDETYALHIDNEVLCVRIANGELSVQQRDPETATVRVYTDMPTYLGLLNGQLQPTTAITTDQLRIEGDLAALERFLAICGIPQSELTP